MLKGGENAMASNLSQDPDIQTFQPDPLSPSHPPQSQLPVSSSSSVSIPDYFEESALVGMACGSCLLGLIIHSFPLWRLWFGVIPALVVGLGLLGWRLIPALRDWSVHRRDNLGINGIRSAATLPFWTAGKLIEVFLPVVVFAALMGLGMAIGAA